MSPGIALTSSIAPASPRRSPCVYCRRESLFLRVAPAEAGPALLSAPAEAGAALLSVSPSTPRASPGRISSSSSSSPALLSAENAADAHGTALSALSCGLPSSLGRGAASKTAGAAALQALEASRKQREQQDSLLLHANKQLAHALRKENSTLREAAKIKRVGGAEPSHTAQRLQERSDLAESVLADGSSTPGSALPSAPAFESRQPSEHTHQASPSARKAMSPGRQTPSTAPSTPAWARASHHTATPPTKPQPHPPAWSRASPRPPAWAIAGQAYQNSQQRPSTAPASPSHKALGVNGRSSSTGSVASRYMKPRRLMWPDSAKSASPMALSTASRGEPVLVAEAPEDSVVDGLLEKGYLSNTCRPWQKDPDEVPDDLLHITAIFSAQMPDSQVLRVLRVETSRLAGVYDAVGATMPVTNERLLWHGTLAERIPNIVLSGFNRTYCGRHGTKFGQGTYFSSTAGYSARFCDRRNKRRVVILANVLVGSWTKGSPDLVEPPHCNAECLTRFDSTVDDAESPSIFCIFRDCQALPLYLVEFEGGAG